MPQQDLQSFGASCKARCLFDLAVEDMRDLESIPACWRLIGQQLSSADSLCANMEEGCRRRSSRDFVLFLQYSRGSARETRGRYQRLGHRLPVDIARNRVLLGDEIISILTSTIQTPSRRSDGKVKKEETKYPP